MKLHLPAALFLFAASVPLAFVQAADPTLGAHNLVFYPVHTNQGGGGVGITTSPINTQTSGSTILALIARGHGSDFTGNANWATTPATNVPTDNKGNAAVAQLGSTQTYAPLWANSGEALFAWTSAIGGTGQTFHAPMLAADEITLAVVEVKNGGKIQDFAFNKVVSPNANTSLNVTTTGPATLVAFWLGDDGGTTVTATPNNGFNVIDSQLISSDAVETVVATRDVATAGTYNVSWNETPTQGAHLWLVAIQNVPEPSSITMFGLAAAGLLRRKR